MSATSASLGRLMVLEMAPLIKGWAAPIIRIMTMRMDIALPFLTAFIGAVEHSQVLIFQERSAFLPSWCAYHSYCKIDVITGEARASSRLHSRL